MLKDYTPILFLNWYNIYRNKEMRKSGRLTEMTQHLVNGGKGWWFILTYEGGVTWQLKKYSLNDKGLTLKRITQEDRREDM